MIPDYSDTECKSLGPQVGSLEADGGVLWSVSKDKLRDMLRKSLVEPGLNWYMHPPKVDALEVTEKTHHHWVTHRFIHESRELDQISLPALCVLKNL